MFKIKGSGEPGSQIDALMTEDLSPALDQRH
jgi:hypothetical protein